MPPVSALKLGFAKAAGAVSRGSGRGGGTSLPGKVLLKLQPDAIARLSERLPRGVVVISATNGKTTTASLLAGILRRSGVAPVHNHAGANMPGGIAATLLAHTRNGVVEGDIGLFEVDEAWTTQIVGATHPALVLLGNLFRDQLDRYGELESLAESWRAMIAALPAETRVVLNADDPLLAGLGDGRPDVVYFGIDDTSCAEPRPRHAADSKFCRRCGGALTYSAVQLGHLGAWSCPACGNRRPATQVTARKVALHGMDGASVTIDTPHGSIDAELPLPGLYNVYNAVAAAAAAHALGLSDGAIAGGLAAAQAVFGRVETLDVGGHAVAILLIKNPTGANEVIRTITAERCEFDLWIALNDKTADGRDISWVWDADFEELAECVRHVTCSGTRAEELALRLAYAGVARDRIIVDRRIELSFDAAVAGAVNAAMPLFALPTYTSLLELRSAIARRGEAPAFWSDSR